MLFVLAALALCLALAAYFVLGQAQFGKLPDAARHARMQASAHYVSGAFANTVPTEMLVKGESSLRIMRKGLWANTSHLRPARPLPTITTDLHALDPAMDLVIWLGHSSYFIQLAGKRILVDPVFSGYGAPFSFLNTAFPGTNSYSAASMPIIDILLISHDHWDHLDHQTARALLPKVQTVIAPLGVGAHFAHWGYPEEKLREADWNTALPVEGG